ncbi:unnamed protein product, partial [Candidula unifasciata]
RKVRLPKLNRIEKLTRGLLSQRDVNAIFAVKEIKGKGRGVFLRSAVLRKDSFVLEYEGDIISEAEAQIREKIYANNNEGCYIMSFLFQGAKMAIDATRNFDSFARLLNHSREPNVRFHPPFVTDLKGGLPRIASYALRDIFKGEEIVIDYGVRDGHITWLRNREIAFRTDVDLDSSDDSDCSSSHDSHTGFRTSERPSSPECYASCSSERPESAAASNTHVTKDKQIRRDPDNMALSRGEWAARITRLVPQSRVNRYIAGLESIEIPQKILKCLEVTSERKSKQSSTESVVCLSTSSSGGSSSVSLRTSSSSRKNTFLKYSLENQDKALAIELPSNEAPDSIHKVLEWQKTSPLPRSAMNIQIIGVQSLSDFSHIERSTDLEPSSSHRQQTDSALKHQEIPASSPPHPPHVSEPNVLPPMNSQISHPSSAFSSDVSSPAPNNLNVSVVTIDTSQSDDTDESSSLSSFSFTFMTPQKRSREPDTIEEKRVITETAEVCVVSDDEFVPETPVSELEPQNPENTSIEAIVCDEDDDSSSECEIILTEPASSLAGTANTGCARNLLGKRTMGFSPTAQLQVAVVEPYVGPSSQVGSFRKTVVMTDSEIEQLRCIFHKHILSNNVSTNEITRAINAHWDVFSVLMQRGVTLKQIRDIFNSFMKPKR